MDAKKELEKIIKPILEIYFKNCFIEYANAKEAAEEISLNLVSAILDKVPELGFVRIETVQSKDNIFINHIQSHLKKGEEVICKICGKTAKEIIAEAKGDLKIKED